jgi:hypothetical protein
MWTSREKEINIRSPNPRLEAWTLPEPAPHRPGEATLGELQVSGHICNCFGTYHCPASSDRSQPIALQRGD